MNSNAFTLSAWLNDARLEHLLTIAGARLGDPDSPRAGAVAGLPHLRRARITLTATHPGGGVAHYHDVMVGTDGQRGAVLHPGYLHPGTGGRLTLTTNWNTQDRADFVVRDCQHLEGNLHLTVIEHVPALDLTRFVKDYRAPERVIAAEESKAALSGRTLIIEPHPLDAEIVRAFLRSTQMTPQTCADLAQGLSALRKQSARLVVVNAALEPGDARGVRKILREAGHTRAILVAAGDPTEIRDADQPVGRIDGLIMKPFTEAAFFESVLALMAASERPWKPEQLRSTLSDDPRFRECLDRYAEFLTASRAGLLRATSADDAAEVRALCRRILETGKAYGYEVLSTLASDAVRAVDATGGTAEALGQLDHLLAAIDELVPADALAEQRRAA